MEKTDEKLIKAYYDCLNDQKIVDELTNADNPYKVRIVLAREFLKAKGCDDINAFGWHDLIKNPFDLPNNHDQVLCKTSDGFVVLHIDNIGQWVDKDGVRYSNVMHEHLVKAWKRIEDV